MSLVCLSFVLSLIFKTELLFVPLICSLLLTPFQSHPHCFSLRVLRCSLTLLLSRSCSPCVLVLFSSQSLSSSSCLFFNVSPRVVLLFISSSVFSISVFHSLFHYEFSLLPFSLSLSLTPLSFFPSSPLTRFSFFFPVSFSSHSFFFLFSFTFCFSLFLSSHLHTQI